jgi:mRNA-degrading endonuclease RelE of RelBE toxin-antitoxin system
MKKIVFSVTAEKDLKKISSIDAQRIVKKLQFFSEQKQVLSFAKPLVNLPPATHRFRVGSYRIAFMLKGGSVHIIRISHRKDVYA